MESDETTNCSVHGRRAVAGRSGEGRMTTTRLLGGVLVAVATAAPALAQYGDERAAPPGRYPLIPSVTPLGDEPVRPLPGVNPVGLPPARYATPVMPPGRPPAAANSTALDRVTAPIRQASGEEPDPVGTLTGQASQPPPAPFLPPGSYPSPYYTDGPGCCGPLGRNGRVGYELYLYTGPTWAIGEGEFTRRLQTGWMVGGGGRSLFFNPAHDAAWAVDLGLSYQYNRGEFDDPLNLSLRQPPTTNPITGATTPVPDQIGRARIRALDRTNFNFGFGRDWWMWGPGSTGLASDWNLRLGGTVGGRWGTAHVDVVPVAELNGYMRRQNVTHGVFLELHATVEVPMGTWIWFSGIRAEYGFDWTNLVPPMDGDIHNLNIMLTTGIRF
jgi:hypothetical protein